MIPIKLDQYQQAVVNSSAKDSLILAGAGSGKTTTLLSKIKRLVQYRAIDPESVLVLTFTRVAAQHMRAKYVEISDSMYDRTPEFSTFHAFCYKILSGYPEVLKEIGYSSLPDIADDADMARYRLKAKQQSSCTLPDSKLSKPWQLSGKQLRQWENYNKRLASILSKANVITYDDLSEKVCQLFASDASCVKPIKEKYLYVFVDEFQDTDKQQFDFVMSMESASRTLCGDALQNIYQFRGCSNKPLKSLVDNDKWAKFKLPMNYRSSKQICEFVNNKAESFESSKYAIKIKSNYNGPCVRVFKSSGYSKSNEACKQYALALRSKGSLAVLCRTNKECQYVSEYLSGRGVECVGAKDSGYCENVINAALDPAFCKNWLVSMLSDSDYASYERMRCAGIEITQTLKTAICQFKSIASASRDVEMTIDLLKMPMREATYMLCKRFAIEQPPEYASLENAVDLCAYAQNRIKLKSHKGVYVGTIHSSKGLEYDSVVVYQANGPSFRIKGEENENLLYVACTRAKTNLLVISC